MTDQGVSRRPVSLIVGLAGLSVMCGVGAFFGFVIGMACEPDSGVGCESAALRHISYAAAAVAAALSGALLGAAFGRGKAVMAALALVGAAVLGYAITQVN